MQIRKLKDLRNIAGKKVLLRVDFNVPLDENGNIQDDTRIRESLPTIEFLQKNDAKIIIISHLGRPEGEIKENLRLNKIAYQLSKLIQKPVRKTDNVLDQEVFKIVAAMKNGEIVMLENVRFRKEEEACSPTFTEELASLGDIFVNDAFGTAHRKHSSTAGLGEYLPAYGGFLMEKEITNMSSVIEGNYQKPLTIICGGAKIDTKIGVLKKYLHKADYFLLGGGLANTFLKAAGYNIGNSLFEEDKLETAREIMLEADKSGERFILPKDAVVGSEISENAETLNIAIQDIEGDMKILDIGKWSVERFCEIISKSKTVIWNGPLGVCEYTPFRNGSKSVADFISNLHITSIIGGGDTIDCLNKCESDLRKFTHISTGGGASIEFLAGEKLPGIEILKI